MREEGGRNLPKFKLRKIWEMLSCEEIRQWKKGQSCPIFHKSTHPPTSDYISIYFWYKIYDATDNSR